MIKIKKLKIRCWDKKNKCWIDNFDTILILRDGSIVPQRKEWELMLFTGLLDKQGKEIYEGDIVDNEVGMVGKIIWSKATWSWCILYKYDSCIHERHLHISESKMCKVIGNIYENPELIKR